MKAIDIALRDITRSFRSSVAIVFMFAIPLLVTGMFYFMVGNIAESDGFDLPHTRVIAIPMLAVAYSSHIIQRKLRALARQGALFRYVTGGVLVAFGLYSLLDGNVAF